MALTNCKECENEVSITAKACPKCGAVVQRGKIWPWIIGMPILIFVLLLTYGLTIPEYESKARRVREVCQQLASYDQHYICDQQFEEAIRKGRAESGR